VAPLWGAGCVGGV